MRTFGIGASLLFVGGFAGCIGGPDLEARPGFEVHLWPQPENDRIGVSSASPNADWSVLSLSSSVVPVRFLLNGEASVTAYDGRVTTAGTYVAIQTQPKTILVTDYLDFCSESTPSAQSVTITVVHTKANQREGDYSMFALSPC